MERQLRKIISTINNYFVEPDLDFTNCLSSYFENRHSNELERLISEMYQKGFSSFEYLMKNLKDDEINTLEVCSSFYDMFRDMEEFEELFKRSNVEIKTFKTVSTSNRNLKNGILRLEIISSEEESKRRFFGGMITRKQIFLLVHKQKNYRETELFTSFSLKKIEH